METNQNLQPLKLNGIQRTSHWRVELQLQNASSGSTVTCLALISTASPKTIVSMRMAQLLKLPMIGESKHNRNVEKGYRQDCTEIVYKK